MAITPVFVRSPFNYDRDAASAEHATIIDLPSLTVQSDAADTDINVIVRRFGVTGQIPQIPLPPLVSEFSEITDFHTAMNTIRAAEESFALLSADVRYRFGNDPGRFVDFCQDPANLPELRKMGLAIPEPEPIIEPPPQKVQIVNPEVVPRETPKV